MAGRSFVWHLQVHKFFCDSQDCKRRIFTERFSTHIKPYARWMEACQKHLLHIALMTGGQLGYRISQLFGLSVSSSTLLRRIQATRLPNVETPKVLGVDDWAYKKGNSYGTILVDMEKRKVVDLLPDREANTLKNWLLAHPGVEVICRDRASTYALAAAEAAPQAVQVADRWHLLKNLGDALERFLEDHQRVLQQTARQISLESSDGVGQSKPAQEPASLINQTNRQVRFEQVKALQQVGHSGRSIARQTGLSCTTVNKFLKWTSYTVAKHTPIRSSGVSDYEDYIRLRWQQGEQRIAQLHTEIKQQGFTGSVSSLFRMIRTYPRRPVEVLPLAPKVIYYSIRQVSQWLSRSIEALPDPNAKLFMNHLFRHCPLAQTAHELALRFRQLMSEQNIEGLASWMSNARESGIAALRHFSRSLETDYAAVQQAFSSSWSSGQVEG